VESLYILIPLAILIVAVAISIFIWAVKSGQFEDLDAEGKRILFDERPLAENKQKQTSSDQTPSTEKDNAH